MSYQSLYLAAGVIFIGGYLYSQLKAYILNRLLSRLATRRLREVSPEWLPNEHRWSDQPRPEWEQEYLDNLPWY